MIGSKPIQVAVAKPPVVHMFIDEQGNITDTPSIDEEPDESIEITYVTQEVTGDIEKPVTSFSVATQQAGNFKHSNSFDRLILLDDNDAWKLLTGNRFSTYPTQPFIQIKPQIQEVYNTKKTTITVPIWYWANPSDDTDFTKVSMTKDWEVNEEIADICKQIFQDIYDHPSQPVINIADKGMGTWSVRGKMHNDYKTLSAHSIGASFDINPGTGSFNVNGTVYGNAYGNKPMPTEVWEKLPESHKKYHVLYVDSPIVSIFKSYGFYWGGDWHSSHDCMHLAFLGDGINAREVGHDNFTRYNE